MDFATRYPNDLKAGFEIEGVQRAVEKSGYPLQTEVALALRGADFHIDEEWCYRDRETGKLRATDLRAWKRVGDPPPSDEVNADVCLLCECKRSELPYVFFRGAQDRAPIDFPAVYGFGGLTLTVATDTASTMGYPANVLGLAEQPFVRDGPPQSSTFSRVERRGKGERLDEAPEGRIELSGTDPFNSIVMPLISAMHQAAEFYNPFRRSAVLTLGVCVMDAPMLLADARSTPHVIQMESWVRVLRQEVVDDRRGDRGPLRFYAVDIVHVSFLEKYVELHVLPLAQVLASHLKEKGSAILKSGQARVPDLTDFQWKDVVPIVRAGAP